jgi:hypothetical protein
VRRELEAGESLAPGEVTTNVRNEILGGNFGQQIDNLVAGMEQYGATTDNPQAQREQFRATAEALRNQVIERLRPIIRTDEAKVQRTLAEVQQALNNLVATQAESVKQQSALAQSSAGTAASDLSEYYKAQAGGHAKTAKQFLYATAGAALLLAVLTVCFLFVKPPDYTSDKTADQWIEVTRNAVARLALLSIVGFGVAFCARNYRVNMHLEVLNKRRENALNTFGLMQAGVVSDEARNIVVGELVRAVFTSEETGYLSTDSERTVIEAPGGAGMLTALSAVTRAQQT